MILSEKITNLFMKIFIFPIVIFIGYGLSMILGGKIASIIYQRNDIKYIILVILITSILCFLITGLIHIGFKKLKPKIIFKNWFEWWHLFLMYISGLITFIVAFQPILKDSGIISNVIDQNSYVISGGIFFILTFNYYFYKALVINRDIDFSPYINEMKDKFKGSK